MSWAPLPRREDDAGDTPIITAKNSKPSIRQRGVAQSVNAIFFDLRRAPAAFKPGTSRVSASILKFTIVRVGSGNAVHNSAISSVFRSALSSRGTRKHLRCDGPCRLVRQQRAPHRAGLCHLPLRRRPFRSRNGCVNDLLLIPLVTWAEARTGQTIVTATGPPGVIDLGNTNEYRGLPKGTCGLLQSTA